ncbi:DsbA family protein [Halobacteriovorax sp. HFRX-2_2]|uniref:2-hydroxychromene-2-carboxylate isomerase n=1 Tax=unclassified Halobacteriovorax TaxID=2639665 RepID=UPI00371E79C8
MKKNLNFYFDFTSPYSYLSMMQIDAGLLAEKYEINYCPVMVGRLFALNEMSAPAQVKNKALYLFKEALRSAEHLGVKLTSPKMLPFNSLPYLRMALGLKNDKLKQAAFILETFHYGWKYGHDFNDYNQFKEFITKKCLTPEEYERLDSDRNLKKELKLDINRAFDKGVFGVPTFEVDDDFYWGNHNIDFLAKNKFLDYNEHEEFINFKKFFEEEK